MVKGKKLSADSKRQGKPAKPGRSPKLPRGRPSLAEAKDRPGGRSPMLALRLPADEMQELEGMANRAGVSKSEMIRRLVEAGKAVLGKK